MSISVFVKKPRTRQAPGLYVVAFLLVDSVPLSHDSTASLRHSFSAPELSLSSSIILQRASPLYPWKKE